MKKEIYFQTLIGERVVSVVETLHGLEISNLPMFLKISEMKYELRNITIKFEFVNIFSNFKVKKQKDLAFTVSADKFYIHFDLSSQEIFIKDKINKSGWTKYMKHFSENEKIKIKI